MATSSSRDTEFSGTPRFRLERRLGAGGMGIVYEVFDRDREATIALKTLRNLNPQSLYRLKQEFRALQDLQHPNLVELGELIEDRGQWFFTMELVPGVDFLDYVRPGDKPSAAGSVARFEATTLASPMAAATLAGPVPEAVYDKDTASFPADSEPEYDEARLRDGLGQLARGLHALHSAGKVHRDIKPSNIQVTPDGRVVLLDFGLALDRSDQNSSEQHVVGTAAYMAPEQAASKPVGPEADWYSVGVVLYEALTGVVPFRGSPIAVLMNKQQQEPTPPHEVTPGVPVDLAGLCTNLLRFDPGLRPTGQQVLDRLEVDAPTDRDLAASSSSLTASQPFIGRDAELAVLRRSFDRVRQGTAATVFVRGESGVGKSALIEQLTTSLTYEFASVVTLRGRCYERESVPFKGFDGVVDSLSRYLRRIPKQVAAAVLPGNAALLPSVFPVLGRVEVIAEAARPALEPQDPREVRNRVFAALRDLLRKLAERHPLVVVIDDLQWADADSLLLLSDLTRAPDPPPLLLVASTRLESAKAIDAVSEHVHIIDLDRLPADKACELAQNLLARVAADIDASVAASIAAEADGHPLFIDELVRHAAVADDAAIGPLRLDDAILARTRRLDPGAARLLELVALAGAPIAQRVVCQAAEMSLADAQRELGSLRIGNLVRMSGIRGGDRIEPYHDRVRESVVAALSDDDRQSGHGRLAIALEASGEAERQPEMLVRHLEGAGRVGEATQRAEQGARRARKGLAFDRAAQLYRIALRLGNYASDKDRDLRIRLGETLASAGRGLESADQYLAAADSADPAVRLECQRQAAEQLLISGHIERGLEVLRAVLAEVGEELPTTPRRALASLLWHRTRLRLRGLGYRERHESEISQRELTRLDVYKSVAHGLGVVDTIRGVDFQARGLLLALQTGEPRRVGRALLEGGAYLAVQGGGGIKRGRKLLKSAARIAEQHNDAYLLALTPGVDGLVCYYEGRHRVAVARLRTSERRFVEETRGATWELNTVRLAQMWVLRRLGWSADLSRCFDDYTRDAARRGDRHMDTSVRWCCNDVWLHRDDDVAALADLDSTSWVPPKGQFHVQHYYELRARAEIDLYRGEAVDTLERLAPLLRGLRTSLLLRVQDIRAEARHTLGRCYLARAKEAGDGAALARARKLANQLRNETANYANVWGAMLTAGVASVERDLDGALEHVRDAAELADRAEMELCSAVAKRKRGELLGGDEGDRMVRTADDWMVTQGIRDPERVSELLGTAIA